jgi:hypothetical protein
MNEEDRAAKAQSILREPLVVEAFESLESLYQALL